MVTIAGSAGRAGSASVAGLGIAFPPSERQDVLWRDYFSKHYAGVQQALARRVFENSGVLHRHGVVNPTVEDPSGWSTQERMLRYLTEAMPLGKAAVGRALAEAGIAPADLGLFVVCSCTGYATPGLDILLARDVGMAATTQRLFIGHMGCYAALPGLGTVTDFVTARQRPALLLCLELTSLHIQPSTKDPQQIISHALFSDAAAAVVVLPAGNPGYAVREVAALTDTTTADYMTWDVTNHGFRMGLSDRVPDVLAAHVAELVDNLLRRQGLTRADIDGWVVHPGGPRILNVVRDRLGLAESAIAASRTVLAEHGNCSSPTVLLIFDEVRSGTPPPQRVLALAFGPGLTLYATLLTR
jgi:alkylresorcinol/alkylpyrone synthase